MQVQNSEMKCNIVILIFGDRHVVAIGLNDFLWVFQIQCFCDCLPNTLCGFA